MAATEIRRLNILSSSMAGKYQNLVLGLIALVILALAAAAFSFYQYQKTQKELQGIKKTALYQKTGGNDQLSKILADVSKLMKLPEGEVPTMATISDINKLKDQTFFRNGKNGNVLLIYSKVGKAILYDPADKKIVEVAPVNPTSSPSPVPSPQAEAKVALRNGTDTPGLATKTETEIKKTYPQMNITLKDNAVKNSYDKTMIILLNQAAKEKAANLSKIFNAAIADLPSGETKPVGVDILVILGKDRI